MSTRRIGMWWTGASLGLLGTALGVPALEVFIAHRTGRKPVPGPHLQDGMVHAGRGTEAPLRCIWLGDSLASGVGADCPEEAFPRQVAELVAVAADRPVDLTCLAQPGAETFHVLAEQVPIAVALLEPGMTVLVAVGGNDVAGLVRPKAFRANYAAILDALSATGATVVAVGLPDMGSAYVLAQPLRSIVGQAGRHMDRIVRDVAQLCGAQYVAIGCGPPGQGRMRARAHAVLSADRWHPNAKGYRLWADLVAAHLLGPSQPAGS